MPGRGMAVPVALKCRFHLKSIERIFQDFIMRGMAVPVALKCKFHLKSGENIIQDFIMRGMAAPIASWSYHLASTIQYHFPFKMPKPRAYPFKMSIQLYIYI